MLSEYQLKISDLYNITIDNVKMLVPNFFDKKVCDQGRRNRRGRRSGGPCPPPPQMFFSKVKVAFFNNHVNTFYLA